MLFIPFFLMLFTILTTSSQTNRCYNYSNTDKKGFDYISVITIKFTIRFVFF